MKSTRVILLLSCVLSAAPWGEARGQAGKFLYDDADRTLAPAMPQGQECYDHRVAADPTGGLWIVWQSDAGGQFDVMARRLDQTDGLFPAEPEVISESLRGDWRPDVSVTPDGEVCVVWDAYDGESFNVLARWTKHRRWQPVSTVTAKPSFEGRARVACAGSGRAWVVWAEPAVDACGRLRVVYRHVYHLGFIASSDHLSTGASYACVWTPRIGREPIFRSVQARRTFGATDNIRLVFTSGEHWMGEEFTADEVPRFGVEIDGTAPIEQVMVYDNGLPTQGLEVAKGASSLDTTFRPQGYFGGSHYIYLHIIQTDGNQAWSSPIWVTCHNPDPLPEDAP